MPILQFALPGIEGVQSLELTDRDLTIGRSEGNALVLKDDAISRYHATIRKTKKGFVLTDNDSANGTHLNGKRISEHILEDGDEILFGKTLVIFANPPDPDATVMINTEDYLKKMKEAQDLKEAQEREESLEEGETTATPTAQKPSSPSPVQQPPAATPPPPPPPQASQAASPPPPPPPRAAAPPVPPPPPPAPRSATPPPPPPRPRPAQRPGSYQRPASSPGRATGPLAGFWIRLLAYLLDGLILAIVEAIIIVPVTIISTIMARRSPGLATLIIILGVGVAMVISLVYILYFWAKKGATPGKMICGLKIVRDDGVQPMGWGKAFVRLIGYLISGFILYIGFIMIAFTERKQGLHDMIAGTTVIKTK